MEWRGVFVWAAAVISVAIGAVPALAGAEDSCAPAASTSESEAEVIDGGTLRLPDGRILRLAGIEPAGMLPGENAAALADAARQRVVQLVGAGAIRVVASGEPDRHNRLHANVFLNDGRLLQAVVLAEGLARIRWLPGEQACAEALISAERAAREAKRGLWASHEYAIRKADDSSLLRQIGLYGLVEGRVVSVGVRSRIVFLDFGRDWRRDFTVMVAASAAERFAAAGKKLESLARRPVRVRGVIEESNGPAMRVDNPDAIELLDGG